MLNTAQFVKYGMQVFMATIGSVGFAILFNTKGYRLGVIAVGGAFSWLSYILAFIQYRNPVSSILIATLVVATFAEISARLYKTPVIILLVPMLIPLIPGRDLYYMMQHLIFGRMSQCGFYLQLVLKEAGAIAFGIILLTFVTQFINKSINYLKNINRNA